MSCGKESQKPRKLSWEMVRNRQQFHRASHQISHSPHRSLHPLASVRALHRRYEPRTCGRFIAANLVLAQKIRWSLETSSSELPAAILTIQRQSQIPPLGIISIDGIPISVISPSNFMNLFNFVKMTTRSLGHSVTRSLGHSVTRSLIARLP